MATTKARPEAKPEPKETEESSEPLLKYKVIKTKNILFMNTNQLLCPLGPLFFILHVFRMIFEDRDLILLNLGFLCCRFCNNSCIGGREAVGDGEDEGCST